MVRWRASADYQTLSVLNLNSFICFCLLTHLQNAETNQRTLACFRAAANCS